LWRTVPLVKFNHVIVHQRKKIAPAHEKSVDSPPPASSECNLEKR
jgi:hypothetical protein